MNQNLISVITVSITGDPKVSEFSKYARSCSSIMSCYRITGSYDYIASVCSEDQSALQATLDEVKKLRGVSTVHSTVLLEPLKVNFSVPPKAGK